MPACAVLILLAAPRLGGGPAPRDKGSSSSKEKFMEELLHQFQTRRAALLGASGKRPSRYPEELRAIAVTYSATAQHHGMRHSAVAALLGVDPATLAAWKRQNGAKPSKPAVAPPMLRRVEVVELAPTASALCLYGPRGMRLEGVTIEQVAVLFERLAC
jgi:transposase-like protein